MTAADTDQLNALDRLLSPQLGTLQAKPHECNCVEDVKSLLRAFVDQLRTVYGLPLPSEPQDHPRDEEKDHESTTLVADRQLSEEPGGTTVCLPSSLPIVEDNDEEISHPGITCDSCQQTLRGVRYKCNLCPVFNVCGNCEREHAAATRHGGELKHTFTEIAHPTPAVNPPPPITPPQPPPCVIAPVEQQASISSIISRVLTQTSSGSSEPPNLWSGAGHLPIASISPRVARYESSATTVASSSQQHTPLEKVPFYDLTKPYDETCNKCGFGLSAGRFKCGSCPSFRRSEANHPMRSFYTTSKDDYPTSRDQHHVSCNLCHQTIFGACYKCLHPICSVNLCAACESDNGGMHPLDHPLLKLRTPDSWRPVLGLGNPTCPSVAGSEESRGVGVRRARGSITPGSLSSEGDQSLKSLSGYGRSSWLGNGFHEAGLGLRPHDAAF